MAITKINVLAGTGVVVVALCLYISTLAPTVLEADGGEFQFVAWLPGIAHPTGYPLYIMLGWLWTHTLQIGEVAWRMNLLSALFGAVAVGLTYAVARQIADTTLPDSTPTGRIMAAVFTAAVFAVTPTFWSQAIIAEVYTLHLLFITALLWLALKFGQEGNPKLWPGKLLAFILGLSLTHHRTIILLIPALVIFIAITVDKATLQKQASRLIITYSLLLLTPLLLYLYLPLAAPHTPYAILNLSKKQQLTLYDNSFSGFWNHIAGTAFTGELKPSAVGVDRLKMVWQMLYQQVGWLGILLAVVGLVTLWKKKQSGLLWLTGLGGLTFTAFNLLYFIGDLFVLFIPVWLFVSLWIGIGGLGLAHYLASSFINNKTGKIENFIFKEMGRRLKNDGYQIVAISILILLFLLPLYFVTTQIKAVNQKENRSAQNRWLAILAEPIPPNAVLISNDRNEIMPMWYYQYVEKIRPDLAALFPLIVPQPDYANIGRILDQALASGRPVYLIKQMDGLNIKAKISAAGSLYKAEKIGTEPTNPLNITLSNDSTPTIKLVGYDLINSNSTNGKQFVITLYWQPLQDLYNDYTSYVHIINEDGQGITQSDHKPGGEFYPSSYWQINETLYDTHTLTLPLDTPPGNYQLRVGIYYQPEPGVIKGLGNGAEVGLLTIQ